MKKFIFPILFILFGAGAGIGAGLLLRPAPAEKPAEGEAAAASEEPAAAGEEGHAPEDETPAEHGTEEAGGHGEEGKPAAKSEYVKLSNRFIVPLVTQGRVSSLIVMSLSLEVKPGNSDAVYSYEPKLRDRFLQILFDHANNGGFDGAFTDGRNLDPLRKALLEAAQKIIPTRVMDVLITDLARQDS